MEPSVFLASSWLLYLSLCPYHCLGLTVSMPEHQHPKVHSISRPDKVPGAASCVFLQVVSFLIFHALLSPIGRSVSQLPTSIENP